jgi:hypothetical protein
MEYDFYFMMVAITILLFIVSSVMKLFVPVSMNSNLVFYLLLFNIMLTVLNLSKNRINCKFSDD